MTTPAAPAETTAPAPAAPEVSPFEAAVALLDEQGFAAMGEREDSAPAPKVETPEPEKQDAKAEPATEEPEAEPEDWTPEKLKSERTRVETLDAELRKKDVDSQRRFSQIEKREEKLRAKVDKLKAEQQQFGVHRDWVSNRLQALRRGDANQQLQALGDLMGLRGDQAYERLSLQMASGGAKALPSPEFDELRAVIQRQEQAIQQLSKGRQQETQEHFVARWREGVTTLAKGAAEKLPLVAKLAAEDPDFIADEAQAVAEKFYAKNGRPADQSSILDSLEKQLRRVTELSQQAGDGAKHTNGKSETTSLEEETEQATVAAAKPGKAQSSPKGQSVPQSIGASAKKRPMTEEERLKAAEDFLPAHITRHIGTG
jgi:hypothetical protein